MKETQFYQLIRIEDELPEEKQHSYITNVGRAFFYSTKGFKKGVRYWLKEISIKELMVDFIENEYMPLSPIDTSEQLNIYLTEKGIIEK